MIDTTLRTTTLEEGLATHLAAIRDRDIDAFAATVADDPVVLVTASGEVTTDREHLLDQHRAWFSSGDWSIETRTLHCRDHGGLGSCVLELRYRALPMDGGESVDQLSILTLLFEQRDGRWLLVQDQNTPCTRPD